MTFEKYLSSRSRSRLRTGCGARLAAVRTGRGIVGVDVKWRIVSSERIGMGNRDRKRDLPPYSMEKSGTVSPVSRPRSLRRSHGRWPSSADPRQASGLQITRIFGPEVPTGQLQASRLHDRAAERRPVSRLLRRRRRIRRRHVGVRLAGSKERRRATGAPRSGHRPRPVPLARATPSSGRRRTARLAVLRRAIRGDVVHVAHPGQSVPRQCRDLVRLPS